jgi:hypothetical protein
MKPLCFWNMLPRTPMYWGLCTFICSFRPNAIKGNFVTLGSTQVWDGGKQVHWQLKGGGGVRTVGRKADQFHSVKWPVSSFLFFKKSGVINFWKQHDFTVIKATSISILVCVNSRFAKLCVYTFVLNRYYTKWFSEHRIEIRETQQAQYMKRPTLLRLVRYFSVASLYYCSVGWGAISLPTMSTALQFGLI